MAFSFKFSADGTQFTKGLAKMKRDVAGFAKSAGGMMAGAFLGGKAIQGLRGMADELDRVGKLATRLGASAEEIQRLGHAAELNGASFEQMMKGLTDMNRTAEEAVGGNKRMEEGFAAMGIKAEEFLGLGLTEKVGAMSDGFIKASKNAEGQSAAQAVLGISSKELIVLLKQGSAAIEEQGATASVASEKLVVQAQVMNDKWTILKSKVAGFFFMLVDRIQKVTPIFVFFKEVFQNAITLQIENAIVAAGTLFMVLQKIANGDFLGTIDSIAVGVKAVHENIMTFAESNAISKDKLFDTLNFADITERATLISNAKKRKTTQEETGAAAVARGEAVRAGTGGDDKTKELARELAAATKSREKGEGSLKNLKAGGVDSSVIASSLRSIGGGGSAIVTRDPALQIAKRQEMILKTIAENTALVAREQELTKETQTEF